MAKIKAIETVYNGYKFRSRLEARWAVFFDAAFIEYEYEPEGFELEDGTRYLPDFYLPELKVFVEVKGVMSDSDFHKIESLVKELPDEYRGVYVVQDIPNFTGYKWRDDLRLYEKYENEVYCDPPYMFCMCPVCGKLGLEFDGRGSRVDFCNPETADRILYPDTDFLWHGDKGYTGEHPRFMHAYDKARQARFEHGEQPVI